EMRDHAHLGEELAVFVEVNAPGIAAAFSEHFENSPGRMITPDAGVHQLALSLGHARSADMRRAEHAVATVEPAVRSPGERVQYLVRISGVIPAIQKDLRIAGRPGIVPIADRDVHQVWRRADPHTTETDLESAHEVEVLQEHAAFVELVVVIGVFEDEYPVCPAKDILELFRGWLDRKSTRLNSSHVAISY